MLSFRGHYAHPGHAARIRPALSGFADECCGVLARLVVYVGSLALLAIVGIHLCNRLPAGEANQPTAAQDWRMAPRPYPAFAVSQQISPSNTVSYETYRHSEGGRKDVLRWTMADEKPAAEFEIYRPGGELSRSGPAIAAIADRMDPAGAYPLETAGVVDSKFGPVTLLRVTGREAEDTPGCLGFLKEFDDPRLRISGWSCQGQDLAARRSAIGCMLNRLILLTAGNDRKLAELFAIAELRRSGCATAAVDWTTEAENPGLRGGL